MVKLMFFCRRRPDVTHDQYARLVLEGHVPLALRHHPTMQGYVVNVVEASSDGLEAFDSVAALEFETLDDFHERLYGSPEGRAEIERDVQGFMGGADAYVTREHVHKDIEPGALGTRSPGVKLVCPVRRRDGMTHDEFVEHWLTRHVPLALKHHPGLSRYVTNVVEGALSEDAPPWDGIGELHFPSLDAFETGLFDSPEGAALIRADVERFIGTTGFHRVAEYVQKRRP